MYKHIYVCFCVYVPMRSAVCVDSASHSRFRAIAPFAICIYIRAYMHRCNVCVYIYTALRHVYLNTYIHTLHYIWG